MIHFGHLDTLKFELDVLECKWLLEIVLDFPKMLTALRHWLNFHWLWRIEPIVVRRYGVHFWKYFPKFNRFWNGKLRVSPSSAYLSLLIILSHVFYCMFTSDQYIFTQNRNLQWLILIVVFFSYFEFILGKTKVKRINFR